MIRVTILAVGKIKEKFFQDAIREYEKRLSKYCRLEIIEVPDEKTPEGASPQLEEQIKQREGERILRHVKEGTYLIPLAIQGKRFSSTELASKVDQLSVSGRGSITFVIGGSLGLSQEVLRRGDLLLSFSDMTFPHPLMRVILLEQIYRCFRINSNEPYHK